MRFLVLAFFLGVPALVQAAHRRARRLTAPNFTVTTEYDPETIYDLLWFSSNSCDGEVGLAKVVSLGGGCYAFDYGTGAADIFSVMFTCDPKDPSMMISHVHYSQSNCSGVPDETLPVTKAWFTGGECQVIDADETVSLDADDLYSDKFDRPMDSKHLPPCLDEITCGKLQEVYRQSGCCGNPNKMIEQPMGSSGRRLATSAHFKTDEGVIDAVAAALETTKATQGPKAAADFAAKIKLALDSV
eukprot:TRINITY_DN8913_c0_g1_i2.p1 TRINITY_DN8913_c0_g1~~TRINITY_DN8913_c0_g1_i2.p1  ORF type:complete len:244 (+),score=42.79 TRINITY_DN8913_c0_g1_i2:88-819(+)